MHARMSVRPEPLLPGRVRHRSNKQARVKGLERQKNLKGICACLRVRRRWVSAGCDGYGSRGRTGPWSRVACSCARAAHPGTHPRRPILSCRSASRKERACSTVSEVDMRTCKCLRAHVRECARAYLQMPVAAGHRTTPRRTTPHHPRVTHGGYMLACKGTRGGLAGTGAGCMAQRGFTVLCKESSA